MAHAQKKYLRLRTNSSAIAEELQSFRGQSPLTCGVWDTDDHLKTYDLIFLLANTEYVVMEKGEFMQEVRRRSFDERDFRELLLYIKIEHYVPERMQLTLGLNDTVEEQAIHHVSVRSGFFVREPRSTWLDQVNFRLKTVAARSLVRDT